MTAKSNAREGDGVGAYRGTVDELPSLWRKRAARKQSLGLSSEAEIDLAHAAELEAAMQAQQGAEPVAGTPSSRWAANGEPDPHGTRYDCERAALAMGDLTDDELANAVFLHGDTRPSMADLVSGKAMLPIAYLTAAKDRIRWLSRKLAANGAPR